MSRTSNKRNITKNKGGGDNTLKKKSLFFLLEEFSIHLKKIQEREKFCHQKKKKIYVKSTIYSF